MTRLSESELRDYEALDSQQQQAYRNLRETNLLHEVALHYARDDFARRLHEARFEPLPPERRFSLYTRMAEVFREADMNHAAEAALSIATQAAQESPPVREALADLLAELTRVAEEDEELTPDCQCNALGNVLYKMGSEGCAYYEAEAEDAAGRDPRD